MLMNLVMGCRTIWEEAEEQEERFDQDSIDFERHCQGQYNENVMEDYI